VNSDSRIDASLHNRSLLETTHLAPGPASRVRAHVHPEFQFSIELTGEIEYHTRRAGRFVVGPGVLTAFHPDESHSVADPGDRAAASSFRIAFVPASALSPYAAGGTFEADGTAGTPAPAATPTLPATLVSDSRVVRAFRGYHEAAFTGATPLELDQRFAAFAAALFGWAGRHRGAKPTARRRGTRERLGRAREVIHDRFADPIRLDELAASAGMHPVSFCRSFRRAFGMPPHRYQIDVRLAAARRMLAAGVPAASVAAATGFSDQAHLSRQFRRLMLVPPGQYGVAH
jgi:AraC-like DNA-binding protein